jgi:hypothetical protein
MLILFQLIDVGMWRCADMQIMEYCINTAAASIAEA